MSFQQKQSGLKCWDSFCDLTLKQMEVIPFPITSCSDLCSCQICNKKQQEIKEPEEQKKCQIIINKPRQRRFSICGFKDDLLTISQMLQKQDEAVRPININILDTIILKDREFVFYAFYDNGFKCIKNKSFFHTEMEKYLLDRKIEFEINNQIKQIKAGVHPTIKFSQYHENSNSVTAKLKQQISDLLNGQSILMARYQTGETTLIGKFELHQLSVLSKTNAIFDNLLHLQLYLYNEKSALDSIEINKRNPKDYFIHRYKYIKDNFLFDDIAYELSFLTDPSLRGQKQWNKEKEYSDSLDLKEYFKYTCHKIAVYIQSFHKLCINEMEVHFTVNNPKNISIINIIGLKMSKAEETQWIIKTARMLSTAEKIQINNVDINENNKPQKTQRSLIVSQSLTHHTKKVIEKIKPITAQVMDNNRQGTRTQDVFKTLNPETNESINQILENQQYQKMMKNFPKQLKRHVSIQRDSPIKPRMDELPLTSYRDVQIEDYIFKSRLKRKPQIINSPFLRSISRRFFTRRNSVGFC
ncbi:unnamed protein product (macronuclear) [Paramecium tetraurelia]|uniref:Uncharacterized protein n=1 Tax=Paramecium tetraurelia TaxID=5888 RepID=A0DYH0_PARTE|nr:uncharacterized protein GSPATT00003055001 [Paramecium tetraurelia]CAK88087.1 unnamed protein product [Paramecium tetraurelia]|eukprot:XP_001455484.1 hypothetical protein (macronuclear) [Paramecium tetraurelia strain d4-2]